MVKRDAIAYKVEANGHFSHLLGTPNTAYHPTWLLSPLSISVTGSPISLKVGLCFPFIWSFLPSCIT